MSTQQMKQLWIENDWPQVPKEVLLQILANNYDLEISINGNLSTKSEEALNIMRKHKVKLTYDTNTEKFSFEDDAGEKIVEDNIINQEIIIGFFFEAM